MKEFSFSTASLRVRGTIPGSDFRTSSMVTETTRTFGFFTRAVMRGAQAAAVRIAPERSRGRARPRRWRVLIIDEVRIPACSDISLRDRISTIIGLSRDVVKDVSVLRRSVDARKGKRPSFVYRVAVTLSDPALEERARGRGVRRVEGLPESWAIPDVSPGRPDIPVGIVGTGPAGLFAALVLLERGVPVVLFEMGKPVEERVRDVADFWRRGILREESNVQFGEGGAGTFSDGKLTTRIKAREREFVLSLFEKFAGREGLRVEAKPHVGTNRLRTFLLNARREIEERGGKFLFSSTVTDLTVEGGRVKSVRTSRGETVDVSALVVAPGNGARKTFSLLASRGIPLQPKPFAVGVRVEHPQDLIDRIQYGSFAGCGCLPPADYTVSVRTGAGDLYSFCMCPGGFVLLCPTGEGEVVVNGMSPSGRRTGFANSGFVIQVHPPPGSPWDYGIRFQESLERKAYSIAGETFALPASRVTDFVSGRPPRGELPPGRWAGPERVAVDLSPIFPPEMAEGLREGLSRVGKVLKGFVTEDATVYAVESRTSSPVRIVRGKDYASPAAENLYPAGEGAGYAGGITSSAVDGVRVAVAILRKFGG
ncbi:MAG: hypothetical protein D6713_02400 [Deltaproteobacteria bacterium]|nr:MAG: hypothetical protein D6713_02400 [Deltaproteobacteria bacterium]